MKEIVRMRLLAAFGAISCLAGATAGVQRFADSWAGVLLILSAALIGTGFLVWLARNYLEVSAVVLAVFVYVLGLACMMEFVEQYVALHGGSCVVLIWMGATYIGIGSGAPGKPSSGGLN